MFPLHFPISDSIDEVEPKIYIFNKFFFGDTKAVGPGAVFGELLLQ